MKSRLSRRSFLKLAGVTAAASTLPASRVWGVPALIQPERTITIGINTFPSASLDTHYETGSQIGGRVRSLYCEQLTNIARNGEVEPRLASDWTVDGTEWRFTLRPDVQFQDGSTLTAEDVVFSLNRVMAGREGLVVDVSDSFTPYITSVEATGDLEVTITTPTPDPLMPLRLASDSAYIIPQGYTESVDADTMSRTPITAGPYRIVETNLTDLIVMERHSEYWQGAPAASQVILRVIPETSTRLAAFQAGEIDLMVNMPLDLIEQINNTPGLRVSNALLGNWMSALFSTKVSPVDNVNFRRALSKAIDRQAIVDALWLGLSEVMTDYFVPGEFGFMPGRAGYPYDPDGARRDLEAAGYAGEPFPFTPIVGYYPNDSLIGPVLSEMWQAVGVNVTFEQLDPATYGAQLFAGNTVASIQSIGPSSDPFFFFELWASEASLFRANYYTPPAEFDELWAANLTELDQDVRYANFRRMADIFDNDVPLTPLYRSLDSYGVRADIIWEAHPSFEIDFRPGSLSFE
ncbi:MAG: twin-arginine translocation signal domain-containing protein [Chloroflexi bacterium]|nr:twin-arginine translocation signal domain-containing protein [Chloroflexota bacterium]